MGTDCPKCKIKSNSLYVCTTCGAPLAPVAASRAAAPQGGARSPEPSPHKPTQPAAAPLPTAARARAIPVPASVPSGITHAPAEINESDEVVRRFEAEDESRRRRSRRSQIVVLTFLTVATVAVIAYFLMRPAPPPGLTVDVQKLPPEVAQLVQKPYTTRDDIGAYSGALLHFGTDAESQLSAVGASTRMVATTLHEQWAVLEQARLVMNQTVGPSDVPIMSVCASASQTLGDYLEAFVNGQGDTTGKELHSAFGELAHLGNVPYQAP